MAVGDDEISDILVDDDLASDGLVYDRKSKRRTRRLTPAEQLALAAEMVLGGKRPMDIAKKLRISYDRAATLYGEVYEQVWQRVGHGFTPQVLEEMKLDLAETLLEQIHNCRSAVNHSFRSFREDKGKYGSPNTKPYTHVNAAIKLLNSMYGFNAPQQIETTDRKIYSLLNPAVHARVMADPKAREALLQLEEFAAAQFDDQPQVVIDVTEGGDE